MYNERRWNYLKNSIEEKTEGRKLNLEGRKQELKKSVHIAEEKNARKFEVHRRKGRRQKRCGQNSM